MSTVNSSSYAEVIYMPVMVIFCDKRLVEMTADEFRARHALPAKGGHVLFSDASNPHFQVTELLDRKGYLYRVTPVIKRRSALSWFAPVWDFTKMECELEKLGPLTVGELLKGANKWTNESGRKVRAFLAKQDPNALFDTAKFREAWEPPTSPFPNPSGKGFSN